MIEVFGFKLDMKRMSGRRKAIRTAFGRFLTKIDGVLAQEISEDYAKELKIDEFLSLKSQLVEILNDSVKSHEEVQMKIEIADMAAEIYSCEEYKDRGIEAKSKIDRYFEILYKLQNVISSDMTNNQLMTNIMPDNDPFRNEPIIAVKLPKLNIQTFYGDCSHFLVVFNAFEIAIPSN